ncbi:hypothetical protein ACWD6I_13355 [Streptomyces sp. NPDC002454]
MIAETSRDVLERLRAVTWYEWEHSYAHRESRRILMGEHMRRAALWADAYGVPERWPFFDIAQLAVPGFRLDDDLAADLDDFVTAVTPYSIGVLCASAVRWASVHSDELPDLPHPYEPIVLMFERGGGYNIEEMIDLYGVSVPYGDFAHALKRKPFLSLGKFVLDTFDSTANDRVSYFVEREDPAPRLLFRRRVTRAQDGGQVLDEVLSEEGKWRSTDSLREGISSRFTEVPMRIAGSVMADLVPQ